MVIDCMISNSDAINLRVIDCTRTVLDSVPARTTRNFGAIIIDGRTFTNMQYVVHFSVEPLGAASRVPPNAVPFTCRRPAPAPP